MRISPALLGVLLLTLAACSRERMDWREAQSVDTVDAYERFVREHPDSELAAPAHERMAQLTQQRDWQLAAAADSARAHRSSPSGTAAATPVPPAGAPQAADGYAVQLGAFSSEERAQEAWRTLERSVAEQPGGAVPRVLVAADHLYRLQVAMPDERHARELCARLKERAQPCVVVAPPTRPR
jgi:hypothetical protein